MIIEEIKKALTAVVKTKGEEITVVSRKDGGYKTYKVENKGGVLKDYIGVNFDSYEIYLKGNGAIIGKYDDLKSLKYAIEKGILGGYKNFSFDTIRIISAKTASSKVKLSEKYLRYNAERKKAREVGKTLKSFTKEKRDFKTEEEIKKAVKLAKEFLAEYGEKYGE